MKQHLLGTGLSGLVGSRIVELLSSKYEFSDLSLATGVDITDWESVETKINSSNSKWILHLAAKADVDACETDKPLRMKGAAWKINVEGTRNIADAAQKSGKRVLYISTDFVFDGQADKYSEASPPRPLNWYALTKYEGEKIVLTNPQNIVARIAYPYRADCPNKLDFIHNILKPLKNNQTIPAVTDHIFTPTFIDDIALAISKLLDKEASGIYHLVGSSSLTPYDAATEIARVYNFPENLIRKTTRAVFYKNRAERPYKLCIGNAKIVALGADMRTFSDGLATLKNS